MNNVATKAFKHLTVTGKADRTDALKDLIGLGAFTGTEGETTDIIEAYLTANARGFCEQGIKRFRDGTGIVNKPKTALVATIMVTVELDPAVVGDNPSQSAIGGRVLDALDGWFIKDPELRKEARAKSGIKSATFNEVGIFEGGKYVAIERPPLTTWGGYVLDRVTHTPPLAGLKGEGTR